MEKTVAFLTENGKMGKLNIKWNDKISTIKNLMKSVLRKFEAGSVIIATNPLYVFSGNGAYKWSYKADKNKAWNGLRASL